MGSYSWKGIATQTPETIKWFVLAALGVFGAARGWEPGLWETLGVGGLIERGLQLFYVGPVNKAKEINNLTFLDQVVNGAPVPEIPQPRRLRPLRARRN